MVHQNILHAGHWKGWKMPWPWPSNLSEQWAKQVFHVNLVQIRSVVPEIFHTQAFYAFCKHQCFIKNIIKIVLWYQVPSIQKNYYKLNKLLNIKYKLLNKLLFYQIEQNNSTPSLTHSYCELPVAALCQITLPTCYYYDHYHQCYSFVAVSAVCCIMTFRSYDLVSNKKHVIYLRQKSCHLPWPPGTHLTPIHQIGNIVAWWQTCRKDIWPFFLRRTKNIVSINSNNLEK